MSLDPQISLETRLPQVENPLQVLGNVASLENAGALRQERIAQAQARQQQLQDQSDIREALQANPNDPDAAVQWLYRTRANGRAAGALSKDILATRKEQADGVAAVVKGHKDVVDFLSNIAAGVSDQQSHDTFRSIAQPLLERNGMSQVMSLIPSQYDPAQQKKLLAMGTGLKKKLDNEKLAIENIKAANEAVYAATKNGDEHAKAVQERDDKAMKMAAPILAESSSQQDLNFRLNLLSSQGFSAPILARFGNQWSSTYGAKAMQVAMTPNEVSVAQHQKTDEDLRRQQVGLERDRLDFEKSGGATAARGITPAQRAEAERWKVNENLKLEDAIRTDPGTKAKSALPIFDDPDSTLTPVERAAVRRKFGQDKLRIENGYRAMTGLPTIEDTEAQIKARIANGQASPTDARDLRIVRNKYRMVTGTPTALEQMEQKAAELQRTTDPAKRAELAKQLKALRDQYRSSATSPEAGRDQN